MKHFLGTASCETWLEQFASGEISKEDLNRLESLARNSPTLAAALQAFQPVGQDFIVQLSDRVLSSLDAEELATSASSTLPSSPPIILAGTNVNVAPENVGPQLHTNTSLRGSVHFELVGTSPPMMHLQDRIKKCAGSDANVLIYGEVGTETELVARAIHEASTRAIQRFRAIRILDPIPSPYVNEALFGTPPAVPGTPVSHEQKSHPGLFSRARGGTLYFDEICDLSLETQAKVIQMLRVGLERDGIATPGDVRIIAATRKNLSAEIAQGRFLQALYAYIGSEIIEMPPLRNRNGDIELLVRRFVPVIAANSERNIQGITSEALKVLCDYSWPGNVEELLKTLHSMVYCANFGILNTRHFDEARRVSESLKRVQQRNGLFDLAISDPADSLDTSPEILPSNRRYNP